MRYASSARWCSRLLGLVAGVLLAGIAVTQSHAEIDPRPSWTDGVVKQSITGFVGSVTKGGPHFAGLDHRKMRSANGRTTEIRVGKLDKSFDEATAKGWNVVDMKNDRKTIYPRRSEE